VFAHADHMGSVQANACSCREARFL